MDQVTITLDTKDLDTLNALADAAVRSLGLQGAVPAIMLLNKINSQIKAQQQTPSVLPEAKKKG